MVVFLTAMNVADAQLLHHHHAGRGLRGGHGLATGGQSAFRQVSGEVPAGIPGRFWFEANVADEGLGYNGSYLTLGSKRRLFEDFLDGRWLFEAQLHHSIDENEGDFFTNLGIERVFSIPAAGADVSIGGWYDYNGETEAAFSNPFHQVGISGAIKSRRWDLLANGYFPIGDTDVTFGDPTGVNPFAGNSLLSEAAFDAAQTGFDVTMRLRPKQMAFANGTIDFGGYGYKSDLVDFFGGARARLGFQVLRGAIVSAEVNHDDRFNTTGVLSVAWIFGANGGVGGEYAGLARDLEPTLRNDHIVRVTNEAAFVINPITGLPYNVVHVNNEGGTGGSGEGTFERPFLTLLEAEAASAEGDAIFVDSGDGTSRNYQNGIELKRNQMLLGDGGTYGVPDARNGGFFQITNDGGTGPTITNPGGTSVVELAHNNRIAGVNIDATGATYGINGEIVNGGTFEDVTVQNAGQDGVRLFNVFGDWDFRDNNFSNNTRSGLLVDGVFNNTSTFLLQNNVASNNLLDGIAFRNFDTDTFIMDSNTTSGNARHGVYMNNFANSAGNGINVLNHTAAANLGHGINIEEGNGKLNIFNPVLTNNAVSGIRIRNWANVVGQNTVIAGIEDAPALITGNGLGSPGIDILIDQPGVTQNVLITNTTVDGGGGIGISGVSDGTDTILNIDIREGVTVSNNQNDGINLLAKDSGIVNANIGNPAGSDPLSILNNGEGGGSGIQLTATGIGGQPTSQMNAIVDNVLIRNTDDQVNGSNGTFIVGNTDGVAIDSTGNAVVDVLVSNSVIGGPPNTNGQNVITGIAMNFANDGHGLTNKVTLDNLTLVVGDDSPRTGNQGTGVLLNTFANTESDVMLMNSTIRPNLTQSPDGARANNGVFGDTVGNIGIQVFATGEADVLGFAPPAGPDVNSLTNATAALMFEDVASDGVDDNLTRLTLIDNVVQDFTFEGINIVTAGDAQMLLTATGNTVNNNGAGLENDADDDGVYNEQPVGDANAITELLFHDGFNIDAVGDSTISARIVGNSFNDNFERGLSINTFQRATINAIVSNNGFLGNDRGQNASLLPLPLSQGADRGEVLINTAAIDDLELINNEEYYFRIYESPVFVISGGDNDNDLLDPIAGAPVEDGDPGIFIPGNTGTDIFGNPVPIGVADLNVAVVNNGIQLGIDAQDFSQAPGDFTLSLEGTNTNVSATNFGLTQTSLGLVDTLITSEELSFLMRGFESK
jgi:hypothetical protein